ncbi:MAG: multinuclear nonheme iron-dependent oxidase, partial [Allorhizobium sp.]
MTRSEASRKASPARLPRRAGAGFKPQHADAILADAFRIGFLEVHAENYMGAGGQPHRLLTRMREDFPLSIHGVGLSIGSATGLDPEHLARLKTV